MSGIRVGRVGHGPLTDFARAFLRRLPQKPPAHAARYVRTCDEFMTQWTRHGFGEFNDPADVHAALQRVLGGTERFPRDLFLAARRFQKARPKEST